MCLSCGCKQPDESHGDQRNITMHDIREAAKAGDVSQQDVVNNIQEGFREFGGEMTHAGARGSTRQR